MKARLFFAPLALCLSAVVLYAADAQAHRLSGHPRSLSGKLALARLQVRHDRATADPWLRRDLRHVQQLKRRVAVRTSPAVAICAVFGRYCSQAIRVASCESHLYVGAQNGQYLGLFQMGSFARSRYGHGSDAWSQARAAFRYFVASGRDWSPWQCKP